MTGSTVKVEERHRERARVYAGHQNTCAQAPCDDCLRLAYLVAEVEAQTREECAALVDARCADVLARQYGTADPYEFQTDVDKQIRMAAVLLPDIAAAIRGGKGE